MRTLTVDLGDRSYPIHIGPGLLGRPDMYRPYVPGRQIMIVSNETVAPLYLDRVRGALDDFDCAEVILPDGESYKNIDVLNRVWDALLEARFDRSCTVLALGGGVVGDMAGFAAASYQRGVHYLQVPTTLLAQVDSSVGGKTGVNHRLGKNMIGAFHQPRAVVADTDSLSTLPDRELSAGIAEIIKYGLIRDAGFFEWLDGNMAALLARDTDALTFAIERSCANKAAVVAADEREAGVRALLNLGHTFGHAIENGLGYGEWLHGEAVAAGMAMAADLSLRLGWLEPDERARIVDLLRRAQLPVAAPPQIGADQFQNLMSVDKKVVAGKLRLVLLRSIGDGVITADVPQELLLATLEDHGG